MSAAAPATRRSSRRCGAPSSSAPWPRRPRNMAPFDASDAAPVFRNDGADKVTGAARYTFDFGLEGMLHAKVLRSPHAHAYIKAIDTSAAEALPGVVTVVTGQDTAGWQHTCYGVGIRDQ